MMRVEFTSFGQIKAGHIQTGDLTIICGPNNSGKTYASYALHSFLRNFDALARAVVPQEKLSELEANQAVSFDLSQFFKSREVGYKKASERFNERVAEFFSVEREVFEGASLIASVPDWLSVEGLKEGSFIFGVAGYRGYKERGSLQLVVSRDESASASIPTSILRNVVGGWIARASIGYALPVPFAITSERTGVSLFYKDLDISRNQLVERLSQSGEKDIDLFEIALNSSSRYALPVKENIDQVRRFEQTSKQKSFLVEEEAAVVDSLDDLLCGGFAVESKQLHYSFKVPGVRKRKRIPIYVASSSIKSLFLLNVFVRHVATRDSILLFDEPELNLHPSNQRKLAGVIVRLVNAGIKVFLTTHSDFLVREISARVALKGRQDNAAEFLKHHGMSEIDLISKSQVKAFSSVGGRLSEVAVTEDGIDMDTLNEAIGAANNFFEDSLLLKQ